MSFNNRSLPFPILSAESLDYQDDCFYAARVEKTDEGDCKIAVHHELGGGGLAARLIEARQAAFACVVARPKTLYRRLFVCAGLGARQIQDIDFSDSGYKHSGTSDSPLFHPIIISNQRQTLTAQEDDRLSPLWQGAQIRMPAGAIIGESDWVHYDALRVGFIRIELDSGLLAGGLRCEWQESASSYILIIYAATDLFNIIKEPSGSILHVRSVLTGALTAGLAKLDVMCKESGDAENWWKKYDNLNIMAQELEKRNIAVWGDDNFSPEQGASALEPHRFTEALAAGEETSDE